MRKQDKPKITPDYVRAKIAEAMKVATAVRAGSPPRRPRPPDPPEPVPLYAISFPLDP